MSGLTKGATVRVLYADTDQMGIVNNVQYLRWFEVGRAEWIRARGRSYRDIEAEGVMLPVVEAHLQYRASARYDDLLDVHAGPEEVRAASVTFRYAIRRAGDGALVCEGTTRHACVGSDGKVRRFPAQLGDMLRAREAKGEV
jgi:acyl-CoA thioester hydrolase